LVALAALGVITLAQPAPSAKPADQAAVAPSSNAPIGNSAAAVSPAVRGGGQRGGGEFHGGGGQRGGGEFRGGGGRFEGRHQEGREHFGGSFGFAPGWGFGGGYGYGPYYGYNYGPYYGYGYGYPATPYYYGPDDSYGYYSPEPYSGGDEQYGYIAPGDDDPPANAPANPGRRDQGAQQEPNAQPARYGYLGVSLGPVMPALARQLDLMDGRGVVVLSARPDSPAGKAGIRRGDVITQANDQVVYSVLQLAKLVAAQKPGQTIRLTVIHEAKPTSVSVELGGARYAAWHRMAMMQGMHHPMHGRGPMMGRDGGMMGERHGMMPWHGRMGEGGIMSHEGGGMMSPERGPCLSSQQLLADLAPLKDQMPSATWDKLKDTLENEATPTTMPSNG
jgi:hypothetical protein